jgi:hypothetical protein
MRIALAEFVPAAFTVPQNPVTDANGLSGLADFVPGAFTVPQVPVGLAGLGCGGECGCGGTCGGHGMSGFSADWDKFTADLMAGNISTAFQDRILDIPAWAWAAGGAVLVYALVFSGGEHSRYRRGRSAFSAARRAYA